MANQKKAPETQPPAETLSLDVPNWLKTAGMGILSAFVTAFLGVVIAASGGAYDLATWKAAVAAGIAAGIKAIDALIGNAVSSGSTSIVGGVQARRKAAA